MSTKKQPSLPHPVQLAYEPMQVDTPGAWLVLSDAHFPYHDMQAIHAAVEHGRKRGVVGIVLNGDMADCHEISRWDKDPTAPRYTEEVRIAKEFLTWLRHKFPKSRIIYRAGNHEERLETYIVQKAPALFGLEVLTWQSLLELEKFKIEYLGDKKILRLDKLNLMHGHEFRPPISNQVNPARGLFLRSKSTAACGHCHQTSEHHEKSITDKPLGCWSIACLCQLHPRYMPLNNWNHGTAIVTIATGGGFHFENFRIREGKIL